MKVNFWLEIEAISDNEEDVVELDLPFPIKVREMEFGKMSEDDIRYVAREAVSFDAYRGDIDTYNMLVSHVTNALREVLRAWKY